MTPPLALVAPAVGIVLAGTGIVVGLTRHGGDEDGRRRDGLGRRSAGAGGRTARPVQAISAVVVGLVVAVTTRWAVAAAAATAAAAWLPALLRTTAGRRTERLEAIATWTELLRDTLSAAAGLGQAIVATADLAPRAVREPVVGLAARLSNGMAMDDALRAFAADLDEPSGDMVVCALLLAASAQSQRLTALLGALAQSCREEVAMHLRVEASRASARSSVRTVALFSLAFATVLFVVAHSYLAPFGTTTGQLVLLVVCACYAAGFWLMVRLVRPRAGHRLLLGGERT